MREIKFRAWVGKMEYDITTGKFGTFYINKGAKGNGLDDRDSACLTPFNTKLPDDTPVMQYTGLKDKNGKEIYKGDILFTSWQHDGATNYDYEIRGEVKWDSFRYKWSIEHVNKNNELIIYPFYSFEREELDIDSIEVIGNIYENPELIEK